MKVFWMRFNELHLMPAEIRRSTCGAPPPASETTKLEMWSASE